MAGKWEGLGYNSQSEADFALCCYISRHSNGSEAIIDHMFRNSGMMRDKWDERRPGGTYATVPEQLRGSLSCAVVPAHWR